MYKTYWLIKGGADPFRVKGKKAGELIGELFPEARGAVMTRACKEQVPGRGETSFNATLELWFHDAGVAEAAAAQGLAPLLAEGVELVATLAGLERTVMRKPGYAMAKCIKGVYPFRRKVGMAVASFQDYWWHGHGPIAARTEGALAYFQVHPLERCYDGGEPGYDGITELHWPNTGAALQAVASQQMAEEQGKDAVNFADLDSVELLLVDQEVLARV